MTIKKTTTLHAFWEVVLKIIKVFIFLYVCFMTYISIDGFMNTETGNNKKAEFAIVYGAKVESNGEPSKRLQARLDTAFDLLKDNKIEKIIVSGWVGETGFNEAEVMKKYLLNKWVKIPWVIVDSRGDTTMDTSRNAYNIVKTRGYYPNIGVIGVSQFFHISRVKLSLGKAWFVYVWTAIPDYFEKRDIYSLIREVPAYIKYFFMQTTSGINIDKDDLKIIGNKVVEKLKDSETYKLNSAQEQ